MKKIHLVLISIVIIIIILLVSIEYPQFEMSNTLVGVLLILIIGIIIHRPVVKPRKYFSDLNDELNKNTKSKKIRKHYLFDTLIFMTLVIVLILSIFLIKSLL